MLMSIGFDINEIIKRLSLKQANKLTTTQQPPRVLPAQKVKQSSGISSIGGSATHYTSKVHNNQNQYYGQAMTQSFASQAGYASKLVPSSTSTTANVFSYKNSHRAQIEKKNSASTG